MAHSINDMVASSLEGLKNIIDVDTVIGKPITSPDGSTIIPVSKVSFGYGSGGSDIPSKAPSDMFGGATGAGVSIKPIAFLVLKADGDVRLLQFSDNDGSSERLVNIIPQVIDKVSSFIGKDKKNNKENTEEKE